MNNENHHSNCYALRLKQKPQMKTKDNSNIDNIIIKWSAYIYTGKNMFPTIQISTKYLQIIHINLNNLSA